MEAYFVAGGHGSEDESIADIYLVAIEAPAHDLRKRMSRCLPPLFLWCVSMLWRYRNGLRSLDKGAVEGNGSDAVPRVAGRNEGGPCDGHGCVADSRRQEVPTVG
jgi:hypothetical protein